MFYVICLHIFLWSNLVGGSEQHVAIAKIDIDDVAPLIFHINEKLGLQLDAKVLADYASSLAVGNSFEDAIDVYYQGIVFELTYKIRKEVPKSVFFYFSAHQKEVIDGIREEIDMFIDDGHK